MNPDNNLGGSEELVLGGVNKTPPANRACVLVRFDLSELPANAVITNVVFEVSVLKKNAGSPPERVGVHRLIQSWGEGDKTGNTGAFATAGEATWTARAKGTAIWAAPGGLAGTDFVTLASAGQSIDGVGRYRLESTPALTADVQAWLANPAQNFGWILISEMEDSMASARRVASRESAAEAPSLVVGFTVLPPPQIVNFNSIQLSATGVELGFRAEAGNIYSVWFRDTLDVASWRTFTNVVSKFVSVDAVVTDPARAATRFYQLAITGQVD